MSSSNLAESEDKRKEQLRKAGQEYFDKVLQQASKGPVQLDQPSSPRKPRKSKKRISREDPDLEAFGVALEGSKLYFLIGVNFCAQAAALVMMKGSLVFMKTPAVVAFFHMITAAAALFIAKSYGVLDFAAIQAATLRGAALKVVLHGVQVLCVFGALLHGSVYLVLSWMCLLPALLEAAINFRLTGARPAARVQLLMALTAAGAVLEMSVDPSAMWVTWIMLVLWTVAKSAELVWRYARVDPTLNNKLTDGEWVERVRQLVEAESALDAPTSALLQAALPAVPALLLGFVFGEGVELVQHEPSVPALSVVLLSCVAGCGALLTALLLEGQVAGETQTGIRAASLAGTIILDGMERAHVLGWLAFVGVILAAAGSVAVSWVQHSQPRAPSPLPGQHVAPPATATPRTALLGDRSV